jgi:hypothetical protein
MPSVADYAGRTADVLAFYGAAPGTGDVLLVQSLAGNGSGAIVAGIQKLVQRFLVTLLTEMGSWQYFPAMGSGFLTDARRNYWRTVADVRQSFAAALLDVARQLQNEELPGDPPDECYGSATLLSVLLTPGSVNLRIQLTSLAGTSYQFIAPIDVILH